MSLIGGHSEGGLSDESDWGHSEGGLSDESPQSVAISGNQWHSEGGLSVVSGTERSARTTA